MITDLKPCPFCGASDPLLSHEERDGQEQWELWCVGAYCGCVFTDGTEQDVIDRWNTRVTDSEIAELKKALESAVMVISAISQRVTILCDGRIKVERTGAATWGNEQLARAWVETTKEGKR